MFGNFFKLKDFLKIRPTFLEAVKRNLLEKFYDDIWTLHLVWNGVDLNDHFNVHLHLIGCVILMWLLQEFDRFLLRIWMRLMLCCRRLVLLSQWIRHRLLSKRYLTGLKVSFQSKILRSGGVGEMSAWLHLLNSGVTSTKTGIPVNSNKMLSYLQS